VQTVYFIRHAMPEQPYSAPYDRPPGPFLSATGREQARRTGRFLANKGIRRLYHSPLARAIETAAIVADFVGRPSEQINELAERRQDETAENVHQRVTGFWQRLVADSADGPVAWVTHGDPIERILRYLCPDQPHQLERRFWGGATTPPAGVWRAQYGENGAWAIELIFDPESFL
jgi:broad specificity phosphatase PhoE